MNRLTNILFAILLAFSTYATGATDTCTGGFFIIGKNDEKNEKDFLYQLGENLPIKATGDCLISKISEGWKSQKTFKLFFDGVPISVLTSPPEKIMDGKEIRLDFTIARDSEDDDNRKLWDGFFKKKRNDPYEMPINPSIAIGDDLPSEVKVFITENGNTKSAKLKFYVASEEAIHLTVWICSTLVLAILLFSIKYTNMLRDAETNCYSLGKTQMAFWGLLVVSSFVEIWVLTGTTEYIPSGVLILLGISGGTGLSSIVIGNSKETEEVTEKRTQLAELELQLKAIKEQETVSSKEIRKLKKMNEGTQLAELELKYKQINTNKASIIKQMSELQQGLKIHKGFWQDICSDTNGSSFQRLQVVIWTMVLGCVFVNNIMDVMSMPEFSPTLLTLLGISNSIYIGFKFPEKQ
jgi:hypothetical protein